MAFENLTDKLTKVFKNLRSKGRLTEEDVKLALKEVKLALLEAELGPCLLKEQPDLWHEYIKSKAEHYRRLLRQMEVSAAAMNSDKYKNLKNLLGQVDGLISKSL